MQRATGDHLTEQLATATEIERERDEREEREKRETRKGEREREERDR